MKAILLAAGLGTRLRPITDTIPKCLVPINEKPLLQWWIELFEKHGINEVLINLHHLPDQVIQFIRNFNSDIKFNFFFEEKLLGSGGTLRQNKKFVENEEEVLIAYSDNLTNFNLNALLEFHRNKGKIFSMALFNSSNPSSCGIAVLDKEDTITEFEEKPAHPKSTLANAGIYYVKPEVFDLIPEIDYADIGFHLLPLLVNKMAGWQTSDYLIDIGSIENLKKAEQEWPLINKELK
jgi:mannose-1-phosphate guanylyltransferase